MSAPLEVVAAVVQRAGRVLVARRADGARRHQWEFPGGKVRPGEDHPTALRRELEEELDLAVHVGHRLASVGHAYADLALTLYAYACVPAPGGEPQLRSGDHDALRWVRPERLSEIGLCAADRRILSIIESGEGWG